MISHSPRKRVTPPVSQAPGSSSVPSSNSMLCVEHFRAVTPDFQSLLPTSRLRDQQGWQLLPCSPLCVFTPLLITGMFIILCGREGSTWLCFQHFVFFTYHCCVFRVYIYSAILTGWVGLNCSLPRNQDSLSAQSPKKAYQTISNGIHRTPARTLRKLTETAWGKLTKSSS